MDEFPKAVLEEISKRFSKSNFREVFEVIAGDFLKEEFWNKIWEKCLKIFFLFSEGIDEVISEKIHGMFSKAIILEKKNSARITRKTSEGKSEEIFATIHARFS